MVTSIITEDYLFGIILEGRKYQTFQIKDQYYMVSAKYVGTQIKKTLIGSEEDYNSLLANDVEISVSFNDSQDLLDWAAN